MGIGGLSKDPETLPRKMIPTQIKRYLKPLFSTKLVGNCSFEHSTHGSCLSPIPTPT